MSGWLAAFGSPSALAIHIAWRLVTSHLTRRAASEDEQFEAIELLLADLDQL